MSTEQPESGATATAKRFSIDFTDPEVRKNALIVLAGSTAITLVTLVILRWMGRVWWCKCGTFAVWSGDIWSMHNSQHFIDPYSFTHYLHGFVFYGFLFLILRKIPLSYRAVIAIALEACWEVAENTERVIQSYRESTISLDYTGDAIANSFADIVLCCAGFATAAVIPAWVTALSFVLIEGMLLLWIRDSLIVNVIMLFYPIEAIKNWQMGAS